jgi:hypothetical protein
LEKICDACGVEPRCVMTGANVYLSRAWTTHSSDLFMCFRCFRLSVYGLNPTPLTILVGPCHPGEAQKVVPARPDVVAVGNYELIPAKRGFSRICGGDLILLPYAIYYITERCGHHEEMKSYFKRASSGFHHDPA